MKVKLFYQYLCVDVTMRQKVDISVFHFRDSVFVNNLYTSCLY